MSLWYICHIWHTNSRSADGTTMSELLQMSDDSNCSELSCITCLTNDRPAGSFSQLSCLHTCQDILWDNQRAQPTYSVTHVTNVQLFLMIPMYSSHTYYRYRAVTTCRVLEHGPCLSASVSHDLSESFTKVTKITNVLLSHV